MEIEYSDFCSMIKRNVKKLILYNGVLGRKIICIKDCYDYYKKLPNLKSPVTIGEKIQWIKVNYYNPIYVKCADKILVKDYVRARLGEMADEIFPKTYHIYDRSAEIKLSELPERFVIKPNHSSGKVIICTDKSQLDEGKVICTAERWLRENFYYRTGEWQYKEIKPRIICEELIEEDIVDYKIYCFDGDPKFVRTTKHNKQAESGYTANFYDPDWKEIGCILRGDIKEEFLCPDKWEEMLWIAKRLSEDFFFVRVDLYEANEKIYFAELTFTSHSGLMDFEPAQFNYIFGDMIKLPIK